MVTKIFTTTKVVSYEGSIRDIPIESTGQTLADGFCIVPLGVWEFFLITQRTPKPAQKQTTRVSQGIANPLVIQTHHRDEGSKMYTLTRTRSGQEHSRITVWTIVRAQRRSTMPVAWGYNVSITRAGRRPWSMGRGGNTAWTKYIVFATKRREEYQTPIQAGPGLITYRSSYATTTTRYATRSRPPLQL